MTIIVGRVLAPSTSQGLKMIAAGIAVKPPEVVPESPASILA